MSCSNSTSSPPNPTNEVSVPVSTPTSDETVGAYLDRRIEVARKTVENLCVTKAKLEALNVLSHPKRLYEELWF